MMPIIFRQLRWKIIGGHMLVVVVGVMVLAITSQLLFLRSIPTMLDSYQVAFNAATTPAAREAVTVRLLETLYQETIFFSLLLAAGSAVLVGLMTGVFLMREILRPLAEIARSSQRIAGGHYDERIAVPDSDELAAVATHFNQMAEVLETIETQRVALIGNVSHELRTPLTGIEGYLEGMMDGVLPPDTETFAQMYQEVRRLRRLVNDLQSLSRIEAGQIPLHLEDFELRPVLERVVAQLQPQAQASQITLILADTPHLPPVHADVDRTAQILVNLIGNAIRYTPDGGQVSIQAATTRTTVEIAVSDTGVGIPAEALPYIFERFYRVDYSRARSSGGSGIGLTISRHLAWAMHGELTVASDGPGQGSTFTLTLPPAP